MEASRKLSVSKVERTKVFGIAAVAGFVATLAIVGLIMLSEVIISYPLGFFYAVIGNVFPVNGIEASMLGFYMHIITGTSIGIVSAAPIVAINRLYVFMENIMKRLLYGVIMGFLVWIMFFIPISYTYVADVISHLEGGFLDVSGKAINAQEISNKFSSIVGAALAFHIQYGLIYAVITGAFISRRMRILKMI